MKTLIAVLMFLATAAKASDFSAKAGLDASSFGGIVVHNFMDQSTVSGLQWDAGHFSYKGNEFSEAGLFGAYQDTDKKFFLGPSAGAPGATASWLAGKLKDHFNWNWLDLVKDYGGYAHAYVNVGWDFGHIQNMHPRPDLVGFGGVLKFGN